MRLRQAFTLIELLVVISVIAVLMGILIPLLRAARERAKRIVCTSNCKQIGIGMHMYADAWDGKVLPYTYDDGRLCDVPSPMPYTGMVAYFARHPGNQEGDYAPMHLAVLYEEKMIQHPKVFYCPAQPIDRRNSFQCDYDYHTDNGSNGCISNPELFEKLLAIIRMNHQ